ncbi:Nrap protein [Hymenopellis radicata]|nr:Nrap protein [Hymenopellis radicata]
MAANLKRKRENESQPGKARKVSPVPSHGSEEESENSENAADEEEEWGGVSAPAPMDVEEGPSSSKPSKPPTGVEVREMREAGDLYRSSTFKMQIDELLPNVRPKEKQKASLEPFLMSLHKCLNNVPSSPPTQPLEAARPLLKKGISVPYSVPLPSEDSNWKVAFEPPSNITLVGSWNNKTSVKGMDGRSWGIDIAVEMPDSLFQEKDYLNGRFFHKRAFYLAKLAAAICDKKSGLDADCAYQSHADNPRLTRLVVQPRQSTSKPEIFIIPILSPTSPLALKRLSPSNCNVHSSDARPPTPLYNTAILTALTPPAHLLAVHKWQQEAPAFTDALSLLRVWANQRGFSEGSGMQVHGFEGKGPWWASLLGVLIEGAEVTGKSKRKPLGRGLSSYQLFKAALDFLGTHDWEKQPVFVKTKEGHLYSPSEYEEHHPAVFVDSSSKVNLLADVPIGSLDLLRYEAKKTLNVLATTSSLDPFSEAFLQERRTLCTRFDAVVRIDLSSSMLHDIDVHAILDHGSRHNALLAAMSSRLRHGLGNRTKVLTFLHPTPPSRPLSQALPSNPNILFIGLVYDPEHAFRQVDHGPDAKDPDPNNAAQFRELWGEKAELRMFKDGKILESVVWDVKTADEKSHLPVQVVRHLLDIHFGVKEAQSWHSSYDALIRLPEPLSKMYTDSKLPVGFKGALTAFDGLVKSIKSLPEEELLLHILNFTPISPHLRHTSTFSPVPRLSSLPPNASYIHPMPLIVQFEKSAQWPDDLQAIKKVKLAFFERIAANLMNAVDGLTASVVVGHAGGEDDDPTLEVLTADGWAFSIYIWHDRELTLLNRVITTDTGHINRPGEKKRKGHEYHEAVAAKELYLRRFIHSPRHHRAISKLHHVFASYSGTTRLVKRWFATHWLLGGHVSEEAVELLCAYVFVRPGWERDHDQNPDSSLGAHVPASKERGFAMVMDFLQSWKWEDGVFVHLYESGAEEAESSSTPLSSGVWTIKTEMDKAGRVWTSKGPDAIVARRVRALAAATWSHLKTVESDGESVQPLFTHPTSDYDFLVKLDPLVLPRYHQNVHADLSLLSRHQGRYSNLKADDTPMRIGFDPAHAFFSDLQRIYADTFRIFWDPLGGDTFGAVWDPTLRDPRPFKVLGGFSSAPYGDKPESAKKGKGKDLTVFNEMAVLNEISRMGSGLVKSVTVK